MNVEQVKATIREAFKDVTFPLHTGISLRQGRLIDDNIYDDRQAWKKALRDDWNGHWSQVPGEDIIKYTDAFSFLNPESVLYYLPAFMWFSLNDETGWAHTIQGALLFQLGYEAHKFPAPKEDDPFCMLTVTQRSAVKSFLELIVETCEEEWNRERAERALSLYWK